MSVQKLSPEVLSFLELLFLLIPELILAVQPWGNMLSLGFI